MAPALKLQLQNESKNSRGALGFWGRSLNYDEGAKATIVQEPIIDYLLASFGASARDGRVVHAGVEHTLGQSLSRSVASFEKRREWES